MNPRDDLTCDVSEQIFASQAPWIAVVHGTLDVIVLPAPRLVNIYQSSTWL